MNDHPTTTLSPTIPSPLLTAKEAAGYLSVSVSIVNKLRREGRLEATYIFSDARYLRTDLDAFIANARSKTDQASS